MLIIKEIQVGSQLAESFITILSGVIVFILSQYSLEIIIRPYLRYKNIKYKILNNLKFYSRIITNPLEFEYFEESDLLKSNSSEEKRRNYQDRVNNYIKISDDIRTLSCELDEFYYAIPKWYRRLFVKDEVDKASLNLISLSNSLFTNPNSGFDSILNNSNKLDDIKKYLRLS